MRIALVIERFEPRGGGVEAVAWKVAEGLAAAGDEVHVCARTHADPPPRGVQVHRLAVAKGWQPWRVWQFSRAAARATEALHCDLVQSFSRTRSQDIFRAGGGSHAHYMERTYSPLGCALRRFAPRHALALALDAAVFRDPSQTILCNSQMVRDEIATRYGVSPERLVVIENGVDLERFHPREAEAVPQAREHARVWLFVGSGFRRKGLDTALAALALRPVDEVLRVVGGDPTSAWEKRARDLGVAERVSFWGAREDLPELYRQADALFLPTRYDAFANVCLEAAASGIPCLTSAANGAARWLQAGGIVVKDPEDVAGFAAALGTLRDEATLLQMGRAARERAETRSWPQHIRELRALYERLCA